MTNGFQSSDEIGAGANGTVAKTSPERMLKNFRYIVATVNEDAQQVWSDLWCQFKEGMTPDGRRLPEFSQGFEPPCGWQEFIEKLWLLKHYLDYVQRLCEETRTA